MARAHDTAAVELPAAGQTSAHTAVFRNPGQRCGLGAAMRRVDPDHCPRRMSFGDSAAGHPHCTPVSRKPGRGRGGGKGACGHRLMNPLADALPAAGPNHRTPVSRKPGQRCGLGPVARGVHQGHRPRRVSVGQSDPPHTSGQETWTAAEVGVLCPEGV